MHNGVNSSHCWKFLPLTVQRSFISGPKACDLQQCFHLLLLKHVCCAVRIHIAGKVMARKVDHARSIWKELRSLLETENIILEEAEMEESQCIVGAYRVKGRLVCEDALKVFGARLQLQLNSSS